MVDCPPDVKKKVKALLSLMGEELYMQDEGYIDMATAVSGSGPAVRKTIYKRLPILNVIGVCVPCSMCF